MGKLILLRHGQSTWNKLNLFTGWVDVPLSPKGVEEAFEAGKQLQDIPIDIIFTSSLIRAQMSTLLAMQDHHSNKCPIMMHDEITTNSHWNEIYSEDSKSNRMYGKLQGLNKAETIAKFGAEQVKIWRRSFDVAPPEGESLAMTAARTIPYFVETIVPYLQKGKNVFISAHGNSLRSIVMHIEGLSKEEILNFEIPTGGLLIYDYENELFKKVSD
jgi:2,3-bisphosphoglycerate-dependent phosphoglycerate mutase